MLVTKEFINVDNELVNQCGGQDCQIVRRIGQKLSRMLQTPKPRVEPLIPLKMPELPWQQVGSDLFEWNKSTYLLIVDYYSHYRVGQTAKYHSR